MGASSSFLLALSLLCFSGAMGGCSRCLTTDFCVLRNDSSGCGSGCNCDCKDPTNVTADDFSTSGFDNPGNTSNPLGSNVTFVGVDEIPGLNLLGLSLIRIDFARGGVVPPHTHPRGSEILVVIEGTILVGFITADLRLIIKILIKGDIFVFPLGLIHFQINIGIDIAVAISALSCESPGTIFVGSSLFGSHPRIPIDVLTKSIDVDRDIIETLESRFPGNNSTHP